MLHLWFIAIVAVLYLRDALERPLSAAVVPERSQLAVAFLSVILFIPVWVGVLAGTRACLRRFDRGAPRAVAVSYGIVDASMGIAVAVHAIAVILFGWLDAVRWVIGDVVLVDELVALVPVLATITWCWSCAYDIDRRCRESLTIRHLDTAQPVLLPTRRQFVLAQARHHAALVLVPILMIGAWSEGADRVLAWLASRLDDGGVVAGIASVVATPSRANLTLGLVQLVGVFLVFTFTPVILRLLWDTTPLGAGPMRDRLQRVCDASRVKVRDLLVWRTHVSMINGAVVGLLAPLRYILLTDALLDSLDGDEVEAVMAHEVGHVRHKHMPWLAGLLIVTVTASWTGLSIAVGAIPVEWHGLAELLITVVGFGLALLLLGIVSRRFEWQADAFAVQALTRARSPGDRQAVIGLDEVGAMSGALASVAQLNHIPMRRHTWRHGSIEARRRRLRALDGRRVDRLPIDRTVMRIKLAVLITGVLTTGGILWDTFIRS